MNGVVAVEEHFVAPRLVETISDRPSSTAPVLRRLEDLDELRLSDMDSAGIDTQVVSHTTPGVQGLPSAEAADLARHANDHLAEAIARHPARLAGFATLPTSDPPAAVAELRRACVDDGFVGAIVNGQTHGRFLDDPAFRPLLAEAARLRVPIYVHPGLPPRTVRDAYFAGFDPDVNAALAGAAWGWHAETGLHVLRMVLAGVFEELPELTVMVGHLGEMLPFMLARIDEFLPPARTGLPQAVSRYLLANVVLTTSGMTTPAPLHCAMETFGASRLCFAVDYPFGSNADALARLEGGQLTAPALEVIARGNAERILGLQHRSPASRDEPRRAPRVGQERVP